ncbi:MAG TPA: YdcF family protein [Terriglobales bacterium]|jgi:uncharacterized SAM-binding protein YcdF (DUF218 family)|nr:YdcF family protein [Terriglobales bacterium]
MLRPKPIAAFAIVMVATVIVAANAGRFLVVEDLRKADVILVLDGETDRRPARGLELLRQGYAPRLILDSAQHSRLYHATGPQLAQQFIAGLPPQEANVTSVCQVAARSTKEEAQQAARCLDAAGARSVLLVTSDYHTRRARAIFRRELPDRQVAIAAVTDSAEFGAAWWQHRQWAKRAFEEWLRLIWWALVDRWYG